MSHNQDELLADSDATVKASEIEEIKGSWLCRKNGKCIVNFEILKESQRRHTRKRGRKAIEPTTIIISSANCSKRLLKSKIFISFYKSLDDSLCSFEDYVIELASNHGTITQDSNTKNKNKNKTKSNNDDTDSDCTSKENHRKRQRISQRKSDNDNLNEIESEEEDDFDAHYNNGNSSNNNSNKNNGNMNHPLRWIKINLDCEFNGIVHHLSFSRCYPPFFSHRFPLKQILEEMRKKKKVSPVSYLYNQKSSHTIVIGFKV